MNSTLTGKTLLIVDDEPFLLEALSANLELYGAKVLVASNGEEGLEVLKSSKVDIVISDVRMPKGDGVFLLKEVRALFPNPPPFFFITGYADYTAQEFLNMGATDVLSKPFKINELIDKINSTFVKHKDLHPH